MLEWSDDAGLTYHASDFLYPPLPPGNPGPGTVPVFNGLLADFDTTYKNPGTYIIRMTVFSGTGALQVCSITFQLFKKDVRILGVDNYFNLDTGWSDPNAKFVESVPALCSRPASVSEVSFGECLSVQGGAWVGGCNNARIKTYLLDYKPGFESNCSSAGWTNFWQVDYATPAQYRFINMRTGTSYFTANWGPDCFIPQSGLCLRAVHQAGAQLAAVSFVLDQQPRRMPAQRAVYIPAHRRGHQRGDILRYAAAVDRQQISVRGHPHRRRAQVRRPVHQPVCQSARLRQPVAAPSIGNCLRPADRRTGASHPAQR